MNFTCLPQETKTLRDYLSHARFSIEFGPQIQVFRACKEYQKLYWEYVTKCQFNIILGNIHAYAHISTFDKSVPSCWNAMFLKIKDF